MLAKLKSKLGSLKKYGAEFLVIFFAVFLGALADDYREQYREEQQGEEYLRRFYRDLSSDIPKIDDLIRETENKKKRLRYVDSMKYTPPTSKAEFLKAYGAIRDAAIWQRPLYIPNTITLDQIKSTGAWDFINQEQSDLVTSYQLSVDRIIVLNRETENEIRETMYLIKQTPTDSIRYSAKDFNNRELQNVYNYIYELYWSHVLYANILNQHKYFIIDILQKLEKQHGIKNEKGVYDIMSSIISLTLIVDDRLEIDGNFFLIQDENQPNIWSNTIEIVPGKYVFRKGLSFEDVWGVSNQMANGSSTGRAMLHGGKAIELNSGKYLVKFDLTDTTYSISEVK